MDSRWIASTGARWVTAIVPFLFAGNVGCSGGTFDPSTADSSAGGPSVDDASEKTIVVVPDSDGGADAESDEGIPDATFQGDATQGDVVTNAADASEEPSPCSCTTPHAVTSTCDVDGSCVETQCAPGYLDCDGNRSNGCETEFNTLNCGACGTYCNPSHVNRAMCSSSTLRCQYNMCSPGYFDCDGNLSNGCETASDSGACP
jgi:hypothetical protein